VNAPRDSGLDTLLELDRQVLVVDPEGGHWVRFVVTRVPVTPDKPHGLDYSLTLQGPTASGWSDSTMLTQSGSSEEAIRKTTVTG
jgi:hypothetical protein